METPANNQELMNTPIYVEKGADPRVLVIAFTGFKGGLMVPTFDFLRISDLLKYSRILLADTTKTCYLGGVPPAAPAYGELVEQLRAHIADLSPEMVLCVGASSGAFAALLLGHELKADYIHAFSPYTYVDAANINKYRDPDGLKKRLEDAQRIWALPQSVHPLFDLQPILMQHNGKSSFYIHVCGKSQWDLHRALHLMHCPHVKIIAYTCDHHGIAITLTRQGLITDILKAENQEQIERVVSEKITVRHIDTRTLPTF
jgi:hypothetical protein